MTFDIEALTLGEIAKIEDLSGLSIQSIADEDQPKGKSIAALVFVASRRAGDPLKWDQCLGLTMDQANQLLGWSTTPEDSPLDSDHLDVPEYSPTGPAADPT